MDCDHRPLRILEGRAGDQDGNFPELVLQCATLDLDQQASCQSLANEFDDLN